METIKAGGLLVVDALDILDYVCCFASASALYIMSCVSLVVG